MNASKNLRRWFVVTALLSLPGVTLVDAENAGGHAPEAVPGFEKRGGRYVLIDNFPGVRRRATSLHKPRPAVGNLEANPMTPAKYRLGRLLFYDPILSKNDDMACATCHHPDLGFGDGRPLGMGAGGQGLGPGRTGGARLPRNVPTLWNVAFNEWQFWDGRVRTLEQQVLFPLTSEIEMAADPAEIVRKLKGIPEYVRLFRDAFEMKAEAEGEAGGEAAVTIDNLAKAVASFERTLVSYNSKFDRYVAGDRKALDAREKNGLKLFRSLQTRCFECHAFPNFSDNSFRVVGVPDRGERDLGRAGVDMGFVGAFKVPSLRNVAVTGPYMHNGSIETLEEVIDFYVEGGGRFKPDPPPGIGDFIGKFELSDAEKADLVAFLKALTDESALPTIPDRVPSALPVVDPINRRPTGSMAGSLPGRLTGSVNEPAVASAAASWRPSRVSFARRARRPGAWIDLEGLRPDGAPIEIVRTWDSLGNIGRADGNAASSGAATVPSALFRVARGQSISAAIRRARPGDRIEIEPGTYHESLTIDVADLTLAPARGSEGQIVLDGHGGNGRPALAYGLLLNARGLRLERILFEGFGEGPISPDSIVEIPVFDPNPESDPTATEKNPADA